MKSERVINENPAEGMNGFTVPVGLRWFHKVFPGQLLTKYSA